MKTIFLDTLNSKERLEFIVENDIKTEELILELIDQNIIKDENTPFKISELTKDGEKTLYENFGS